MTTKNEILEYLDNVLHPLVSPEHWNVYAELHDMLEDLPPAYSTGDQEYTGKKFPSAVVFYTEEEVERGTDHE